MESRKIKMRLDRVYASAFYATSPRKDKIHSAINSPLNAPLIRQLSDYLDDDSRDLLREAINERKEVQEDKLAEQEAQAAPAGEMEEMGEGNFPGGEDNVFSPSYHGGSFGPSDFGDDMGDEAEPDIFAEPDEMEGEEVPAEEPIAEGVEESTNIDGESVTADSKLDRIIIDIADQAEIIKGTLNSQAETSGVSRIQFNDRELWIYYKDEVNIGDIMVNVIEVLNGASYNYLTFSRLARSNNAIVFDVSMNLQEPMKSISEVQEE